jgi:hypothetical protein
MELLTKPIVYMYTNIYGTYLVWNSTWNICLIPDIENKLSAMGIGIVHKDSITVAKTYIESTEEFLQTLV